VPGAQAPKAEENKESAEYKKKVALATGPVLNMNYENSTAYGMVESLFTSLKDIFEAIIAHESRIGVVSPHKFLEILRRDNEMFRTPMHQDAHEFLNLLLNQVLENVEQFSKGLEANRKAESESDTSPVTALTPVMNSDMLANAIKNSRWVHELFEGTLTSETRCLTCENISQRDEAFLDLSVDLDMHTSVTSCLRRFSEEEMLCERNKFHCDKCGGLQEAEKRMKIKRLPRILALHLKRFKYTEDMQRLQKLFHRVVYPYYLRLFNTTDDAEDPDRLYELYAVVVHIGGGPYHGHYVSIIKTQDRGWLLFDDELVEPVDKRFVTKFFGEGTNTQGHPVNLACAYVLFYQETTEEAMHRELEAENAAFANPEPVIDPLAARLKANGIATNGIHHAPTPSTPLTEEIEHFVALDHAATIQVPAPPTPHFPPLEATQTSPSIPFLKRKKSNINAKREQERAEKEERERRKAEEKEYERQVKEAEKQAKKKQKDVDALRKENLKRQEEELAARYKAAGKKGPGSNTSSSRAGDDETGSYTSNTTGNRGSGVGIEEQLFTTQHHHLTPQPMAQQPLLPPTSHPIENGQLNSTPPTNGSTTTAGASGSMLHRFRNTSMSLRQKPKFWSKDKDKEKSRSKNSGEHSDLSREAFAVQPQHRSLTPSEMSSESPSSTAIGTPVSGGMGGSGPAYTNDQGLGVRLGQELFPPPPLTGRNFITTTPAPVSLPLPPPLPPAPISAPLPPPPLPPSPQPPIANGQSLEGRKSTEKPKKESRFGMGRKKSVAGLLGKS
jgi:ubiquitin carboxyl-terminal hydrolase 9/13